MPILFALTGPTGAGKTKLGIQLAKENRAEIICMDSRQVYQGFRIGTAQPTMEERNEIIHHLVDFFSPVETYSAGLFCTQVKEILVGRPETNFILVGGSGLYLKSLMEGLPQFPPASSQIRERLKKEKDEVGLSEQYRRASEIDPLAMVKIESGDTQRIWRVLEIYEQTGELFSSVAKNRVGGLGKLDVKILDISADELRQKQAARFDQMIAEGWIDEVISLSKIYSRDCPAFQSLGYLELLENNENKITFEKARERILQRQWQYSRRQRTWNRHQFCT